MVTTLMAEAITATGTTSRPQPPLRRAVEGNRLLIPSRLGKIGGAQDWAFIAEAQPPFGRPVGAPGDEIDDLAVTVMDGHQNGRKTRWLGAPPTVVQERHPSQGQGCARSCRRLQLMLSPETLAHLTRDFRQEFHREARSSYSGSRPPR